MKLYKLMFLLSMMMGTMVAISSYSWFSMWMGLEINLLSIIPLLSTKKNVYSSESSMKYFITQAMASLVLLMSVIMMLILNEFILPQMNFYFSLMLNSALLTKLGAAPFHFWFPEVMEGLSWMNCFILMTWQKIAPMMLIMINKMNQKFMVSIILTSLIVSTLMALNQISLRKIMAFSSINHIAWMLSATMVSTSVWFMYFMVYSFLSFSLVQTFKISASFYLKQIMTNMTHNKIYKMMFMMNFLSLGGLPPFIGFLPKWLLINWMTSNSMYFLAFILIVFTLIMLYIYMRISFSSILLNLSEPKIQMKTKNIKYLSYMNFTMMTSLLVCTMMFNLI